MLWIFYKIKSQQQPTIYKVGKIIATFEYFMKFDIGARTIIDAKVFEKVKRQAYQSNLKRWYYAKYRNINLYYSTISWYKNTPLNQWYVDLYIIIFYT